MNIRLCQIKDIPKILEVRKKTFLHFAPKWYSPHEVRTLLEDINLSDLEEMISNKSLFVAEIGHKLVGCGGWFDDLVKHMWVSPEMTKKGIGSTLLRTLEKDYKNRTKNTVIKAGVMLYARPFFEKNGYTFIKLDTDWDGSKMNWMEKSLSDS